MRTLLLVPLALLASGCLAPGERDPTRYPWDPRNAVPHPPIVARGAITPVANPQPSLAPPQGNYCVLAIAPQSSGGITTGNAVARMACSAPVPPAPPSPDD